MFLRFAFVTSDPMGWLASVGVRISIRLGVVAQAERLASLSELAPEVAFRVFRQNSPAFHHCLMLSATSRLGLLRIRLLSAGRRPVRVMSYCNKLNRMDVLGCEGSATQDRRACVMPAR
jgi:hypothetical protein